MIVRMFTRIMPTVAIAVAGAAVGYGVGISPVATVQPTWLELKTVVDDPKSPVLGSIRPGRSLGCHAVTTATVKQNVISDHHFKGELHVGTDKVALKFSDDARSISMLTANAVSNGVTEAGVVLQIFRGEGRWILAASASAVPSGTNTLMIDTENLNVLWVQVSNTFGMFAESHLMQCQ